MLLSNSSLRVSNFNFDCPLKSPDRDTLQKDLLLHVLTVDSFSLSYTRSDLLPDQHCFVTYAWFGSFKKRKPVLPKHQSRLAANKWHVLQVFIDANS